MRSALRALLLAVSIQGCAPGEETPCSPTTCAALSATCGTAADGCGGTLDCGACAAPATCGGGGVANECGCAPTTCLTLGADCGTPRDGCGGVLECGSCAGTQTCGGVAPYVCGDLPCTPTTCAAQRKDCGLVSDGCSGTLECGSCAGQQTCGGGGAANVCGCTPVTCEQLGASCGSVADGCGGTLACGGCTDPQTCGGGGVENACGCTPVTCEQVGAACGSVADGCGATLDCGACGSELSCVAGACVPPGIVAVAPTRGSTGAPLVIRGVGFGAAPGAVTVGGRAAPVDRWSPGEIVVFLAADYAPGVHDVVVTPGGGDALAGVTYEVVPWIRSVDPRIARPGSQLTVTGEGFGAAEGAAFVEGVAVVVDAWSNTSVTIRVPAGLTGGQQRIHVATAGGEPSNRYAVTAPGPNVWAPNRAPAIRAGHAAVWTGTEMLVWGGSSVFDTWADGARYNPASDTVAPISVAGAPSKRSGPAVVWTGSEMVVWGGARYDISTYYQDGARYDPVADAWSAMTVTGAPVGRDGAVGVWTGAEVVVWGGAVGGSKGTATGGRYDPAGDRWTAVATAGAPAARFDFDGVWTGTELVVWGGTDGTSALATGGRYDPATDTWRPISTVGAPAARRGHQMVWTGSEVVVWGGSNFNGVTYLNDGGRYDPVTDRWLPMSTASAPSIRREHVMVWTGDAVLVFGGSQSNYNVATQTGGLYHPSTDSWSPLPTSGAPTARYRHSGVWTGADLIVFGGHEATTVSYRAVDTGGAFRGSSGTWRILMAPNVLSEPRPGAAVAWIGSELFVFGGRGWLSALDLDYERSDGLLYEPETDVWRPLPVTGAPSARTGASAVWTGSDVIVWGGWYTDATGAFGVRGDGGVFTPGTGAWAPLGMGGAPPSGRVGHSAVWTGSRLLVWGGLELNSAGYMNSGAIYDPATLTWTAMSLDGAPSPRYQHSTVWTGTEMIVWGGYAGTQASGKLADGARFDPATNTWRPLSATGAPAARYNHGAIWTGSEMLVWGGRGVSSDLADGGRYAAASDTWTAIPATGVIRSRSSVGVVAAGDRMLVWGGLASTTTLGDGASFDPATGAWNAMAGVHAPAPRYGHAAVWTGDAMLVFGGGNSREGTALARGGLHWP